MHKKLTLPEKNCQTCKKNSHSEKNGKRVGKMSVIALSVADVVKIPALTKILFIAQSTEKCKVR
jgi:hypothetical protein